MTLIDTLTIVTQSTLEPSEDDTVRPEAQTWQLGILTDRAGHVHLFTVVAGAVAPPCSCIDLPAPVGADSAGELDLDKHLIAGLSVHRAVMLCCLHALEGDSHFKPKAGRGRVGGQRKNGTQLDPRWRRRGVPHTSWALSSDAESSACSQEARPADTAQYARTSGPVAAGGPPPADITLHVDNRRRDTNTRNAPRAKVCVRVSERPCCDHYTAAQLRAVR